MFSTPKRVIRQPIRSSSSRYSVPVEQDQADMPPLRPPSPRLRWSFGGCWAQESGITTQKDRSWALRGIRGVS